MRSVIKWRGKKEEGGGGRGEGEEEEGEFVME